MPSAPGTAVWPATLTTRRLALRPVAAADVPEIARLWTDPEVRRHLGGPVDSNVVRIREKRCVGAPGAFAVVRQADLTVVGLVTVEPGARDGRTEVSYQLLPEHWGQGYGREAVAAAVTWARGDVPATAPAVVALTQQANLRSRRLLEGLGATVEYTFVEWDEPQILYAFPAPPAE
ncbi:GNAT family N-acetyltransferase [Streptomyces peucetius]|uniref:GNAT family N-acetyltransferase n=1 Tax=Streptomyces peucetius TaxID=1950 RepID=A0ABY6I0L2_STRPE|nr:GNAT family N-acetyltransferase [Streptomyces peucetius]UYQ60511.1 GNAT family N-acetyltransferase [Streptomyces peucetius]